MMVGGLEQMVLLGVLHLEEGAYAVTIRRELERRSGKRVSRGAERADVLRLALGQALSITVAGVGIGLLLAYAAGRLMASNLFGVVRLEVTMFVSLALVLSAVSLLAAYIPARRALAVDRRWR